MQIAILKRFTSANHAFCIFIAKALCTCKMDSVFSAKRLYVLPNELVESIHAYVLVNQKLKIYSELESPNISPNPNPASQVQSYVQKKKRDSRTIFATVAGEKMSCSKFPCVNIFCNKKFILVKIQTSTIRSTQGFTKKTP